jgi:hypothetical protein
VVRNRKEKVKGTDRDIASQLRDRMRERINLERQLEEEDKERE